ncbi:LCP family protein [Cyanobacterium sp. IPPAS B-1200]|uniref:LCP family protein n=1 Tax=Cyanobacterium sp. IPPAS B-1200 TaxID=1562720 RepID=UPI0008524D52|nr:LCP family protein [Cyanobacterium sp. IPPAS B-1200]OEJ79798.1 LytR family transcriptional regulator [Cyanobacterium sp. IPPAS B-1200]
MSVSKVNYRPKKGGPKKVQPPKKGSGVNWLLMGFGLSAIASLSTAIGALLALSFTQTPLNQVRLSPDEEAVFNQEETLSYSSLNVPELRRPINILVLGIKSLSTDIPDYPETNLGYHPLVNSFQGRSDSMMLLRLDPRKNEVVVLSIPRDTRTSVEGVGITKINDANAYGGASLATESVSNLLNGVEIDRYVRINVQGVEKLIDALGGVDFYVPKDMKYTDHSQRLYIDLQEGQQQLDGQKALQLLRFRYDALGDVGRVQRQQALIRALTEQALSPKTVLRIPEILGIVRSHIDTNLGTNELIAMAAFMGQKSRSDFQMVMLPGDFNQPEEGQPSYWLPSQRGITRVAQDIFGVQPDYFYANDNSDSIEARREADPYGIAPSRVRVAIQTRDSDKEIAQSVANQLIESGYNRVFISTIPYNEPTTKTRIVAQGGDPSIAARVRVALGLGEVLVESTGILGTDVTIQVGRDWTMDNEPSTIDN